MSTTSFFFSMDGFQKYDSIETVFATLRGGAYSSANESSVSKFRQLNMIEKKIIGR